VVEVVEAGVAVPLVLEVEAHVMLVVQALMV
jgi:hypothetical protein